MIELITILQANQTWYLNKIYVNSKHIVTITESHEHNKLLREGKIQLSFDNNVVFSKLKMEYSTGFNELIVVGCPATIMEKINRNSKQLLKG